MRIAILTVCFIYSLSALATGEQVSPPEAVQNDTTQPVFAKSAFDHILQLEQDFRVLQTTLLEEEFNTAGFYKNIVEPLNSGAERGPFNFTRRRS
ncbi:MAG: hypothetical protein ABIQ95_12830 [Bdellovibrionia bacterium]